MFFRNVFPVHLFMLPGMSVDVQRVLGGRAKRVEVSPGSVIELYDP